MKQENMKALVAVCIFIVYMASLISYSCDHIHLCTFLTGLMLGVYLEAIHVFSKPLIDEKGLSYLDVFMYLVKEEDAYGY